MKIKNKKNKLSKEEKIKIKKVLDALREAFPDRKLSLVDKKGMVRCITCGIYFKEHFCEAHTRFTGHTQFKQLY